MRIFLSTGLDVDDRRALVESQKERYELWYQKYIRFAKSLPNFQEGSRLSCQLPLTDALDGMEIKVLGDG